MDTSPITTIRVHASTLRRIEGVMVLGETREDCILRLIDHYLAFLESRHLEED